MYALKNGLSPAAFNRSLIEDFFFFFFLPRSYDFLHLEWRGGGYSEHPLNLLFGGGGGVEFHQSRADKFDGE